MYYLKLDRKLITKISAGDNLHIIGIFDNTTNTWYNAWAIHSNIKQYKYYKKSRDLLKYSLNIDIDMTSIGYNNNIILRSILLNSKIYITEKELQIEIILSIITYLLKANSYSILKKDSLDYYIIETNNIETNIY